MGRDGGRRELAVVFHLTAKFLLMIPLTDLPTTPPSNPAIVVITQLHRPAIGQLSHKSNDWKRLTLSFHSISRSSLQPCSGHLMKR